MTYNPVLPAEIVERSIPEPNSGCWLWLGCIDSYGYDRVKRKGVTKAHRLSWNAHFGDIPNGMCILHRCDVPSCVNPDHLFLGTQIDNMRDMTCKGRHNGSKMTGPARGLSKLTEGQVIEIKASSESSSALARRYGVSHSAIANIRNGKTWAWVNSGQLSIMSDDMVRRALEVYENSDEGLTENLMRDMLFAAISPARLPLAPRDFKP